MPQRIDVPGVGPVDFPDDMGDDQIVQAAAELHRQATLPQMPKLNTVFVQGAGDLIGPPPPPEGPVDLPLTDAAKEKLGGLNEMLNLLSAVPDIPGALLNRFGSGMANQTAESGRSALGLLPGLQPMLDVAEGRMPSINPVENYTRFTQGPLGKQIKSEIAGQQSYYDTRLAELPEGVKQTVDFLGNTTGSVVASLPATVGGLPALMATSLATFAPSFDEAISKGASPGKAYAHAINSTLAEAGSEYLGGAAARTSKFLGKMPFLPDALRKFFDIGPRDALKEAIKEGAMSVLKRLGRTATAEGLEEVASTLAQRTSAALLFDPTQLTNTSALISDMFWSFMGGAVGGAMFTPLEAKAAKQMLRSEVSNGIVDQWQQSLDAARKEGALRPEDEQALPEAVSARMKMEVAAQRGDQTMLMANKLRLQKALEYSKGTVTASEIAQQTEAEVLKAAEINRALEDPQHAQQVLQQAIEQFGPDSAVVERLQQAIERAPVVNKGFGMAFGGDIAKGEVPAVRGVPQLRRARAVMGDQIDAPWRQAIESENFTPDQYELRPGKGYKDNLTGRATDQPTDADGRLNQEIEGVYDQQTKKVVFYRGSIYGGTKRLREVARHEGLHQAADTPEGQAKINEFAAQEIGRSQEMRDDVWKLARRYNGRDIPEEYLAHLYEEKKWWREPVDRLRAKLSEWFPKLGPAPAPVAGRILARSIVRNKEVIPNGQEVQSQVQDQEVTQPVPPVLDAAGTAPGTASTPAPAAPAASRITPEASSLLESVRRGGIPMGWTRNLQKIAADHGFAVTQTSTPNDLIAHLERLDKGTAAPAASPQTGPIESIIRGLTTLLSSRPGAFASKWLPRLQAMPSGENEQIALLAELATDVWSLRSNPEVEDVLAFLSANGIEIQDHTGNAFDSGQALRVLAFQPTPGVQREVVQETLKPTIYFKGRHVQMGEVIVASPEKKSAKPPVEPKVEAATPAPATPQKDERPFDGGVNRPRSDEPPIAEGKVRVYHGGGFKEASGDWTPSRDYAEGYAMMNGGNVWYVDLESDSPLLKPAYDDTGLPRRAAPAHFSGTAETRDNAKSLGQPKPAPPVSEPTQETKPPESQATASNKAPSVETKSETNSVLQPTPQEKAVAQSIGLSDGKWEIRSGVAYQDNLTGRATYDVRDANGKPNRAIEGFYDLTSKKIVILRSGITGNRADVRGKTTEERKEDHLRIILARSILSRKPKPSEPVPKPSEAPSEPTAETPAEPSASDLAKEAEAKRKREDAQKAQDEAIAKDERTADNEPPEPTPTPKEEAKIQKKKEQADIQTETEIRRGTVGGMISSGEVVLTKSGRRTTPFPKLTLQTDRGTTRTVKAVDRWLMQNAYDEAVALGDAFAARNFKANIESPTQADKDSAEEYLFGDSPVAQPNGSILKPIGQTETPEPTKDQGRTTATDSVESKGRKPKRVAPPQLRKAKAESTPQPAPTPTKDISKGDRVEWDDDGVRRTGVVLERNAMGVSVDDDASGRRYLLASDRLKLLPPVEATPSPAPTPKLTPAPQNVAPEQPPLSAPEPAPIEAPQPQPAPPAPAAPEVVPPTPVQGESELRKEERVEGKPEASNERKTSTAKALKVQKEYLVDAVTKALEEAPESVGSPDADEIAAAQKEWDAAKLEAGKMQNLSDRETANASAREKYQSRIEILIKKAKWQGPTGITFDVPGDGVFTVVNDKPTLRKFLETVKKRFPKGDGRASEPKMASTSEKSTPKEAALKTFTDRVKVVGVFASTDVTRKVVNRVAHAGGLLIATDGRQMAVIPAGETTTDVRQFNSQTGEQVKFEVDDKGAKSDLAQYPNWRQVLPSDPEWRAKADVAVLLKMVRGALQLWVGEERKSSKPMQLFLDSDGNFGVKAIVPDSGEFESGVTEKSKIIGAFNADYLADGLEAAARMGNQSLWVATDEGLLGPASFLGTDFAYVLMPMRDAETDKKTRVTVKTAEADAQRSTLTEQWRKQLEIETTESTEPKKPKAMRKAKGQKFSIIPTENRETLLAQDVQWFRNEYKSAPEIVFRDEPDDLVQEPVYYDPGFRQIVVVPRLLPRTRGARRSLFLGALADAGINLIPEAFWDSAWEDIRKVDPEMLKRAADALKVDVREPSGRRAVLRRLVEQRMQGPTRYGLVRSLLRMFRAESPTARVVDRVARQIAKQSENFIPETPYTFAPDSQEQVHADVNAAVWGLRSDVYALRDAANEVIARAIEDNQWQRIKNRLGELAEQGESASIGRGRRIRLNIDSPQFIAELEALQVPHNQSDVQAHGMWLDELEARRVVTLMDNLDKNRETLGFLDENLRTGSGDLTKQSSSVIEALKSRIARQQARLDRIETERPAVFDRANSIRRATDGLAEARAARATLTAPEIQPWIETIYEIERSGAIPRGMDEVSPSLRTPIEVASGLFGHHALEIQRSMRERMDRVSERLAKNLRKLQQRRRELRSKQGEVDVRVHELLTSIAGDAEASGGLFSRSVAQQVRERELAISRLAVFLGQAQPNSVAAEFTEALTSGDIFSAMGSASAGELPAGAPSQERPVASDEAFGRNVAMIRAVAQGASITEDVLREILDMANRDLGFRNVVLMLADEADSRSERRMLDVIERVEAARASMLAHPQPLNADERATREGFIAARGMLERLRLERSGASATLAEVEKEIQEAEIEQRSIEMLHQLAARAVELAGGEMGDRIGTAEMVYRTNSHGLHFMEFVKADGTKQEGFTIGPNTEYTSDVIQKIIEWRQAAQEAVEEAQANPTNPPNAPHITRGLAVGAEKALGAIDAYSTPDNLLKTSRYKIFNLWLAKTEFAIRAILPRLIPGIHGRLFAESIAGYARIGRLLDAIAAKSHARRMKLLRSAYESLGLDQYNANHQSDLATAYAEVAHRYREHGSKVAVGDTLLNTSLRNKPITRELVTLLRFDRDLFREAQRIMQAEDYGGIRENLRGIRLVRPAAETGDIGLARKVNSEIERQIAANYEAALAADPKNPDMSQTWVAFPDLVRFHILDSLRSDLAFERNPMLLELEQQYARDIRSGKVPPPSIASAFEDTVSALAVYANNRIASPHETIRKALLDELMVYARVARSRQGANVDSKHPLTRVGTYTGEDDTNEFTSPAAKLIYPSSMYEYGASGSVNDMRGALSNVLDVSQVSMLGSGKAAAEHLRTIADILKNIQDPRMNDEVRAVARWFTNSRPDVEVTQEVANSAATKVRAVAEAIERDLAHIQSPSVSPGGLQKFTGALMPFMLAAPRVGLSNVVGGPLSSRRILTPLIGAPLANLAAFGLTLHSLSYAVYNMTDWMVRKTVGIHLPRLGTSPEVMEWLQSIGWGSRIGYAELEGLKAHMGGGVANAAIRRIGQVGEVLESTVGSKVGTTGTDAHLNRMAATTLVPLMLRRMTAIANSWRNRLAKANIEVSGDVTGEWAIGDADIGNSADFREMLREAGVHPEEFMAALARGEIDRRRFWLHPMGATFANAVLSEWNASTRTNRPSARGLRSLLLGWMTFEVSRTVDMFRQPVDRSATRKLMNTAITAGSMLLSSFAIYYFGVAVRQAMNDAQTTIARELAEAIASPPDDDDDWWDWIQNLLARFVSAWEINSAPQLTPKDKSWWNRPILAIAWDVLQTPAKSLGVDRIATGNGFMAPGPGILLQIAEAGILAARATMEVMTGKNVEAKVDAANSSRAILQSFGELGRVLANFFHGTPRRQTSSAIRDAANAQGVQVVSRTAPSTFAFQRDAALQPELLGAALAFSEANPEDRDAAKKRLVSVAQAIYQRAYDRVIDRGGFTNPVEAKDEADRAGQRAVQSAVSSIEPVTRAIGRSVTPDEYAKLKTSGVLENPEVVRETKAVAAAAQALATTPTPTGRAMVNPSQAVTSPISHAGSGGGGFSSGGSSSSTRRPLGRRLPALRSRMPRLRRAPSGRVPRLRKPPKLRRPRL